MTPRERVTLIYHHKWKGSWWHGYDWRLYRPVMDGEIEIACGHTFTLQGAKRLAHTAMENDATNVERLTDLECRTLNSRTSKDRN